MLTPMPRVVARKRATKYTIIWLWIVALLSHNFSEQRKLRIHNGFSHFGYEIIIKNFV